MAARTWTQTSGNLWSTAANWDGGVLVPQAGDTVTYDATSTANCTVDNIGAFNGTITIAATYSGTITQSASITGIGAYAQAAGTWDRATFNFSNGTGSFTLTGTAIYTGTSGTMTTGGVTYSNTSALTATSGTWNVGGSWTRNNTATFTANSGTINYTAAGGAITDTGATFNLWTINSGAGTVTIATGTTIPLGATPASNINNNNNTLQITGTVTWSGTWTITGALQINAGGTLTGTSTPAIDLKNSLTMSATGVVTNPIGTITFSSTTTTLTLTDTGDRFSATTYVVSQTSCGFVVAASTLCRLGTAPTTTTSGNTFTVTGTLLWDGLWTHTGATVVSSTTGTLTGTTSPTISTTGSITINTTATITNSIGTITFRTSTTGATLTDTADKLSATTYVINMTSNQNFAVAASTTCRLGSTPTTTTGTGTFTNNGTVTYAGLWTQTGTLTFATLSTTTGTSSPALAIVNSITISATATAWTSVNITLTGANGCTYTDSGGKNTGTWVCNVSGGGMTIAASTTANFGASPTINTGSASVVVTGTMLYSGALQFNGTWTVNGVLTATSTPTVNITVSLTVGAAATITNTIGTITFSAGAGTATYTDTGDKLSASSFVINKTSGFTVAASTIIRIGSAPTTVASTLTVTGTLQYSGQWTHTGVLTTSAASTTTGSSSPSLLIDGGLTLNATCTWTSINITTFGSTNTGTYTDTAAKNTGTWTLTKLVGGGQVIAASTTMALGAAPVINFGVGTLTVTGTMTFSGFLNFIGGTLVTSNGSTITGTGSPTMELQRTITISATTTITNPITTITVTGAVAGTVFTDTGDALSGTTWVINKPNTSFTISASTICRVGLNSSPSVGTSTITVTGTLLYSGNMAISGTMTTSSGSTVTGSSTPSISITQSLTLNATSTWTSVAITAVGTAAATTYTDTGGKNTGIWTVSKLGSAFTIAASTTCNLGTDPTATLGTGAVFTVTGTLQVTGILTLTGQGTGSAPMTVSSTGTVTGLTEFRMRSNLTITAGAVWPAAVVLTITSALGDTSTINASGVTFGTSTINKTNGAVTLTAGTLPLGLNPNVVMGTGTLNITGTLTYSGAISIDGSMTTASGSVVTGSSSPSLSITGAITLSSTGTWTSVNVSATGTTIQCTYTDTGAKNSGVWTINKGAGGNFVLAASTAMNLGSNPVMIAALTTNGTITATGTWDVTGSITTASTSSTTGMSAITLNDGNIVVNSSSTWTAGVNVSWILAATGGNRTFDSGGKTFGSMTITGTFTKTLTFAGAGTFTTFSDIGGLDAHTLTFTSSVTQTASTFLFAGSSGKLITINSTSSGVAATLHCTGGIVTASFVSVKDSTVDTSPKWYADSNSVKSTNTTNWIFLAAIVTLNKGLSEVPVFAAESGATMVYAKSGSNPVGAYQAITDGMVALGTSGSNEVASYQTITV